MQSLSDLTAVYMAPAGTAGCQPSVILQPLQQLYSVGRGGKGKSKPAICPCALCSYEAVGSRECPAALNSYFLSTTDL